MTRPELAGVPELVEQVHPIAFPERWNEEEDKILVNYECKKNHSDQYSNRVL